MNLLSLPCAIPAVLYNQVLKDVDSMFYFISEMLSDYLIFRVMMVRAAKRIVTIQNLLVIFDSSQHPRGQFRITFTSVRSNLVWQYSESIVYWRSLEQSDFSSTLVAPFCHLHLHHDRQAFNEEYEAHQRDKQLLVCYYSGHGNDSSDGK